MLNGAIRSPGKAGAQGERPYRRENTIRWAGVVLLFVLALILSLAACKGKAKPAGTTRPQPNFPEDGLFIDPDIVKREMDRNADFLIVDVRPEADYKKDHIVGAINIPFFEMEQRYKELPRDKWLVFY